MGKGKGMHCYPCRISEVGMSEKGMQMSKHFHTALSVSDCTFSRMPVFTGLSKVATAFSQLLGILFLYYTGVACYQFYKKIVI